MQVGDSGSHPGATLPTVQGGGGLSRPIVQLMQMGGN